MISTPSQESEADIKHSLLVKVKNIETYKRAVKTSILFVNTVYKRRLKSCSNLNFKILLRLVSSV